MIYLFTFLSSVLTAMGLGGGTVLVILLVNFTETSQLAIQGLNLTLFIPVALVSVILHFKNGLIHKATALYGILAGLPGAFLGVWLLSFLDPEFLRVLLGWFLLLSGAVALFRGGKKQPPPVLNGEKGSPIPIGDQRQKKAK